MPAARSRPRANITRDMAVMSAKPATPGAYSRNAWASWVTWSGCRARTCAAGTAHAAITAVPSQDISMTARVDPALVRSKSAPSVADSTGNTLVTIAIGSTEQTEANTIDE